MLQDYVQALTEKYPDLDLETKQTSKYVAVHLMGKPRSWLCRLYLSGNDVSRAEVVPDLIDPCGSLELFLSDPDLDIKADVLRASLKTSWAQKKRARV